MLQKLTKGLVWYKCTDLRLQDHSPLRSALVNCQDVSHTFIIDPRQFSASCRGYEKCGYPKFNFLMECVSSLHHELQGKGSVLNILLGYPEIELPRVATELGVHSVYCYDEVAADESVVLTNTIASLSSIGIRCETSWGGGTLYEPSDLPFDVRDIGFFTSFRRSVEQADPLYEAKPPIALPWDQEAIFKFDQPKELRIKLGSQFFTRPDTTQVDLSSFLELIRRLSRGVESCVPEDLVVSMISAAIPEDSRSAVLGLRGGVSAAMHRLKDYLSEADGKVRSYKLLRNGLVGVDYSTKLSPYLATGCVSARQVLHEIKKFENSSGKPDENTYWIYFELLWRDYMRLYALKYGAKIFQLGGPQGKSGREKHAWGSDPELLQAWCEGRTGYPFIDANMRELALTGYMSNRGRQVVASFLVRDLGQDWRHGAEYFEGALIDFDVCSNYGNWQYSAGVGADPRDDRYFNIVKQAVVYDPDCAFIRLWCPELAALPNGILHDPRQLTEEMRVELGLDEAILPRPVCSLLHGDFKLPGDSADGATKSTKKTTKKMKKMMSHGGVPGLMLQPAEAASPRADYSAASNKQSDQLDAMEDAQISSPNSPPASGSSGCATASAGGTEPPSAAHLRSDLDSFGTSDLDGADGRA